MPGLRERTKRKLAHLEWLDQQKPTTREEQLAWQQARQEAMNDLQRESEYGMRMPGDRPENDTLQGNIDGDVMRAPWRGEFDMPGNFERRQSMANSLAEDAALNAGGSHSYGWERGTPVVMDFANHGLAYMANARDYTLNQDRAFLSGPPSVDRMLANPGDPATFDPSGKRAFTERDVKMLRGLNPEMVERLMGDRPFYNEIFGGE